MLPGLTQTILKKERKKGEKKKEKKKRTLIFRDPDCPDMNSAFQHFNCTLLCGEHFIYRV